MTFDDTTNENFNLDDNDIRFLWDEMRFVKKKLNIEKCKCDPLWCSKTAVLDYWARTIKNQF